LEADVTKNKKPTTTAKFTLNDAVRVRSGVTDPDFPDTPLGGWAGKIVEVQSGSPPTCLIRWNQSTLASIHPVYRKRCERDGLTFEEMWLGEDDLEPDTGETVTLEQPTKIVTPPLSMKDQDDRIRAVFGLTRDDLLPDVDDSSLRTYYKYLAANLRFPFEATWTRETRFRDTSGKVTIHALGGSEDDPWIDDTYGILCKAKVSGDKRDLPPSEVEKVKGKPNQQIVEDYGYWFGNHQ